jgi:hypothetical protein
MKIFRLFVAFALACFAFSPSVQGVLPPPPGGYPNFTTAAGDHALQALTLGLGNTAIGTFSLFSVTTGSFNTAVGAGSLDLNTADSNTATGAAALLFNTTGTENTAVGTAALEFNDTGSQNTANGAFALFSNTEGEFNTAIGYHALYSNTTGAVNNAVGYFALNSNTTGLRNNAFGNSALTNHVTGNFNNAFGGFALAQNNNGAFNSAFGDGALSSSTGSNNTAIGSGAGSGLFSGNGNVCIGEGVGGVNGVSDSTYIRNVYDSVATARQVYVDTNNKIGTLASTRRVKDDIEPMARASETILALRPVTFHYKKEIDRYCTPQFGLVAEEVAEVNLDLVTRDREGKPETVRYDAVNAMLLNEFQKEHRKNEEQGATITALRANDAKQEATIADQQKQIDVLTANLQKVSAQLELNKPAPQTVLNDQ